MSSNFKYHLEGGKWDTVCSTVANKGLVVRKI